MLVNGKICSNQAGKKGMKVDFIINRYDLLFVVISKGSFRIICRESTQIQKDELAISSYFKCILSEAVYESADLNFER